MPKFEVKKADDQSSGEEIELESRDIQAPSEGKGLHSILYNLKVLIKYI